MEASNLSSTVISRYMNGERTPSSNSEQLISLSNGLATLANDKNIKELDYNTILIELQAIISPYNVEIFSKKVDSLITGLDIHIVDLAKEIPYDSSYISRIRNGKRVPSKQDKFVKNFCQYIYEHFNNETGINKLTLILECSKEELTVNEAAIYEKLLGYFSNDSTSSFLHKLDEFDLNEYIKAIHFDTLKVPSVPFQLPISKDYYGIKEMRAGELDFLKSTVLSNSMEPFYMYSNMPMEDMAEDKDFAKKWMFGLAMVLKKGITINSIHNLNRPFNELMLGLESWLPLYMTGLVKPYYLRNQSEQIFNNLIYYSGSTALYGQCIDKFHKNAKYHLTRNKKELTFYKQLSADLFTKALPLMEIFDETNI